MRRFSHCSALVVVSGVIDRDVSRVVATALRGKFVRQPSPQWDPLHEDINAHVKKRIPGETRVDRVRRFAREWRNVELELGVYKDSRGREIKYRKTFKLSSAISCNSGISSGFGTRDAAIRNA
ncbi:hypothetical protein LSM04_005835 [Trypanosoma melophagium]|uniref:uncharacterized protein n=1 Tax=Trypanosoma melophagium TaxID=715481 RepID=UPI00351A5BF0|nr:hypothetical protein LSM04_005835 [Trypanosoma melophagium]